MLDPLEVRSPEERAARQFAALREILFHAKERAPTWRRLLAEVDPATVGDPDALAQLPVTRKSELAALQAANPPFGGLATRPLGGAEGFAGVFVSPGPIFEPSARGRDGWRFARAMRAAGITGCDVIHNCFSYHMTPAGAMLESAAHALGAAVFPGGTGSASDQARVAEAIGSTAYAGTPDFLKVILEAGDADGRDLSPFRRALVTGGALFPSLRSYYEDRGIACLQCYGSADLGLVAYESQAREGMILDEEVIVEIVRPGTGDPVPEGEVGEILVTVLSRDYPLIRFSPGDLSAILPGRSPCGRTAPRIRGWMGRADQTTKVRGMFVQPGQVAALARAHPEIGRIRAVVSRDGELDHLVLRCESAASDPALVERISATARNTLRLRAEVELVPSGELPNDGVAISDERRYDAE